MNIEDMTVAEARAELHREIRGKGMRCHVCGRHSKIERRKLNKVMARSLKAIYVHQQKTGEEYVHIPPLLKNLQLGEQNDETLLRHWGLMAPRPADENRKWRGWWTVTPLGAAFIRGDVVVPGAIFHYKGQSLGMDNSSFITFKDAAQENVDVEVMLSTPADPGGD